MIQRLGEIAFVLLVFVPLTASPVPDDADGLRTPLVLFFAFLMVLRVLVSIGRKKEFSTREDPTRLAIAIFFAVQVLSLVKGVNRWESIVPLSRMLAALLLYSFIVSGYLSRTFVIRVGLPLLVLAAGLFSVVGLGQASGYNLFGRGGRDNPVSMLEDVSSAGSLIAMLLPLTVAMIFTARGWGYRLLAVGASGGLLIHLLLTLSSVGWIGAMIGLIVLGGIWIFSRKEEGYELIPGRTFLSAFLVIIGNFLLTGLFVLYPVGVLVDAPFDPYHPSSQIRLETWKSSVNLAWSEPLLGAGPGNFPMRFPSFRSEREFLLSHPPSVETVESGTFRSVDDPRNTFLHILCEHGILGLLSFLLILYVSFRRWAYFITSAPDREHFVLLAALFAAVTASLVSGFFYTLTLSTTHVLFLIMFIGLIELIGNQKARYRKVYASDWILGTVISMLLISGFLAFLMSRSLTASLDRKEGQRLVQQEQYEASEAWFKQSLDREYNNWRSHVALGEAQFRAGKLRDAEAHLQEVVRLHPTFVPALDMLGQISFQLGAKEKAIGMMDQAIRLAPAWAVLRDRLGSMYEAWGMAAAARRERDLAEQIRNRKDR